MTDTESEELKKRINTVKLAEIILEDFSLFDYYEKNGMPSVQSTPPQPDLKYTTLYSALYLDHYIINLNFATNKANNFMPKK